MNSGDQEVDEGGHFGGFARVFERRVNDPERVMFLLKIVTRPARAVPSEMQIVRYEVEPLRAFATPA